MANNTNAAEISRLTALINGATTSVSTDGLSTTFDLAAARARLAELKRKRGDTDAKQKAKSVNLGGCW